MGLLFVKFDAREHATSDYRKARLDESPEAIADACRARNG